MDFCIGMGYEENQTPHKKQGWDCENRFFVVASIRRKLYLKF